MTNALIIPDVHGRTFWREPVQQALNDATCSDIIFLGDYVDPYPREQITPADAFEVLCEIIDLKKRHPERIHLLLGNHDMGYFADDICECRRDCERYAQIQGLFFDNLPLFDLAWETTLNGRRYLLSHAGVMRGWLSQHHELFAETDNISASTLNDLLHGDRQGVPYAMLIKALGDVSWIRGGDSDSGSVIWADEYELTVENILPGIVQIYGHTQQTKAPRCLTSNGVDVAYCLDCRQAFMLYRNGIIHFLDGKAVFVPKPSAKKEESQ